MFAEIGNFTLYFGLILDLIALAFLFVCQNHHKTLVILVSSSFICKVGSMLSLILCHVLSDMTVLNVVLHSSPHKPTLYKIAGAWGSHEGSMMLWNVYMAFFAFILSFTLKFSFRNLYKMIVSIQLSLCLYFTIITLITKPFARIFPATLKGMGMNPVLQDIGLALHPPLLYLGYISCSVLFSISSGYYFTLAKRDNKDKDSLSQLLYFKSILKPWALFSWSFLTIGITLGSWWAYREVGWGGYWFWDPVENASFLPWLALTGLLHSLRCGSQKNLIIWSIIPFVLSVSGTFLVRSGLISSVHSFASDNTRGFIILGLLVLMLIHLAIIWSQLMFKAYTTNKYLNKPSSHTEIGAIAAKDKALVCLSMILGITIFGTTYPIIFESFHDYTISIGSHYFNYYVNPIFLLMSAFTLLMHYSLLRKMLNSSLKAEIKIKLIITLVLLIGTAILITVLYWQRHGLVQWSIEPYIQFLAALGIILSVYSLAFLLGYIGCFFKKNQNHHKNHINYAQNKLSHQPSSRNNFMMIFSHISFALAVLIISTCSYGSIEKQQVLCIGDTMKINNLMVELQDITHYIGPNYLAKVAKLTIYEQKHSSYACKQELHKGTKTSSQTKPCYQFITVIQPELRFFPNEKQMTVRSDIMHSLFYDLHLSVSEIGNHPELLVRAYYRPMINWLWFVGIIAGLGSLLNSLMAFYKLGLTKKFIIEAI